jgi:DNA-binding protein HU-beta
MTTKELISNIAKRSGLTRSQVADLLDATEEAMVQQLLDGKSVHLQGFGALEVRQKKERISVHPRTGERSMIPPKQQIAFRPTQNLKDEIKNW